jgi:hypothetical protein
MRHIDIRELPGQSDDEIRAGETYAVERDGQVLGFFLPVKQKDAEKRRKAFEALDRTLDEVLKNGYTGEQLAEDMDLSKPFRSEI